MGLSQATAARKCPLVPVSKAPPAQTPTTKPKAKSKQKDLPKGPTHAGPSVHEMLQKQAAQALGRGQKEGAVGEGNREGAVGESSGGGAEGGGSRGVAVEAGTEKKEKGYRTATALYAEAQQNGDWLNQPIRRCMTDFLYTTVAKFNTQVKEGDVLRMVQCSPSAVLTEVPLLAVFTDAHPSALFALMSLVTVLTDALPSTCALLAFVSPSAVLTNTLSSTLLAVAALLAMLTDTPPSTLLASSANPSMQAENLAMAVPLHLSSPPPG
uniref:Uncharacterized protein n=1 Tax=Chromera velia CCMP2878 TaxID=1169474 RepID=A0A0G4FJC6_9ALVE|eukprot:Cvel_17282.t1-p1 / transcript=Cvel_17282.t1 / gene=Cvel_17282 / organism=Chromera_velia_CCMP2878 / gene_product=Zinc finger protein 345, putative / transcript_product=Zinc finger protein 345, putative / location=Cvel_scaffold1371:3137-6619(-) / protein_length=267 / sequence_SO=supercontig / SO=protein_coding / is_pseudo=false